MSTLAALHATRGGCQSENQWGPEKHHERPRGPGARVVPRELLTLRREFAAPPPPSFGTIDNNRWGVLWKAGPSEGLPWGC